MERVVRPASTSGGGVGRAARRRNHLNGLLSTLLSEPEGDTVTDAGIVMADVNCMSKG